MPLIRICVLLICFDAWCCAGLSAFIANVPDASREELREFLAKGYKSAKSLLSDVRMISQSKSWYDVDWLKSWMPDPKQASPASDSLQYVAEEYIRQAGKERWVHLYTGYSEPKEDFASLKHPVVAKDSGAFKVFDEQYLLGWHSTKGSADTTTQVGRASLSPSAAGLLALPQGTELIKYFGYALGAMPDDVLSSPNLKIETKPQHIGGILVYKVAAQIEINQLVYDVSYWLSPERSCLPLRMELRDTNGQLRKQMEAVKFEQLQDGTWVTREVVQQDYMTKDGAEEPSMVAKRTYTIRNLQLNPQIDQEGVFSTSADSLPVGTVLYDSVAGVEYIVGEGPVSDERIQRILNRAIEQIPFPDANEDPESISAPSESAPLDGVVARPLFSEKGVLAGAHDTQRDGLKNGPATSAVLIAVAIVALMLVAASFVFLRLRRASARQ